MKKVIALALAGGVVAGGAAAAAAAPSGPAAAPKPLRGTITADGSSTVGPYTTAAAEGFQKRHRGVRVTVGISGTGGGFERFCKGETDLSNASRPMKASEAVHCRDNGVKWLAFTVANDGLSVVVNKANTWASCLTTGELKAIWNTGSRISSWKDVRPDFPDVPLKLFGAGTDSGTFDYFTEAINGKARQSRSDYLATEDDNIVVQGVSGERGGMGYFGFSYYEENRDKLKVLAVDGGKGCVTPSLRTVQSNRYRPLSRPLFVYAKLSSFRRPEVAAFVGYVFNNERAIARKARFVPLTDAQLRKARYQYRQALKRAFR
jgi:phosphate transport system substrate-binding protein